MQVFGEISILGVKINKVTREELVRYITDAGQTNQKTVIGHVNLKAMDLAFKRSWYRDFLNNANLVFCDGFAIVLGAKILGYEFSATHRATCADYLEDLAVACARQGLSIFLLAGNPGVVDKAMSKLKNVAPELRIEGRHGFFDKRGKENEHVIEQINAFNPDVLYIGFGMPCQEQWIRENIERIQARVFLPLGGCLDVYTGALKRAPRWMTDHGFEWVGRVVIEPKRLWKQYIVGIPVYMYRVLLQRAGFLRFS